MGRLTRRGGERPGPADGERHGGEGRGRTSAPMLAAAGVGRGDVRVVRVGVVSELRGRAGPDSGLPAARVPGPARSNYPRASGREMEAWRDASFALRDSSPVTSRD